MVVFFLAGLLFLLLFNLKEAPTDAEALILKEQSGFPLRRRTVDLHFLPAEILRGSGGVTLQSTWVYWIWRRLMTILFPKELCVGCSGSTRVMLPV